MTDQTTSTAQSIGCSGWIERHPAARQIRYESLELDEAGRLVKSGDDVSLVTRVVQLEAEPAEFPEP